MSNLPEVPTDELLSFQDYPSVHHAETTTAASSARLNLNITNDYNNFNEPQANSANTDDPDAAQNTSKSFWTIEYYQKYFDVDTQEVLDRILASVTVKRDNSLQHHLRAKPDLYGPFWISVTLIFTIAISGNIANYLQSINHEYRWKYEFHLVSYAATAIYIYVLFVPFALWAALRWSSDRTDLEGLTETASPGALELICIYGYSLFIYIPVSILWTIQYNWLQWGLVLIAAVVSGSVLLLTLMPALKLSKHKIVLISAIVVCHLLLAAGFMLYFFHVPSESVHPINKPIKVLIVNNTISNKS